MVRQKEKKLNQLLTAWPSGTVAVTSWLAKQGIYRQLTDAYVKGGWLLRIGRGAFVRSGDFVDWQGGLYAIQKQLGQAVHVGAQSALAMKGFSHYLALGKTPTLTLFGAPTEKLPAWFTKLPWGATVLYAATGLFQDNRKLGLSESHGNSFSITVSAPERAVMELLYLIPKHAHFDDAQDVMETLTTLRPNLVQALLEDCTSIRVKRLFMYLAERNDLAWTKRVDLARVDFGKGKRALFKGGVFDAKYRITVPPARRG